MAERMRKTFSFRETRASLLLQSSWIGKSGSRPRMFDCRQLRGSNYTESGNGSGCNRQEGEARALSRFHVPAFQSKFTEKESRQTNMGT